MSGATFKVAPAEGEGAQLGTNEIAEAIQKTMSEKLEQQRQLDEQRRGEEERQRTEEERQRTGRLRDIITDTDSLYKYISWEDVGRTLGTYVGIMSLLFAVHYLPITHVALKAGATLLGAVSITEYVHRQFTSNTLLARLRPEEYKRVPESALNDTLKDIHDLIQYTAVQTQKIVYGEDLNKTFAAFSTLAALFWLVKIVPPFGLVILGVTSIFIAPLLTSQRGREVANDAAIRAAELRDAAVENSGKLAQDGKAKAAELSSRAQQTAQDTKESLNRVAHTGTQRAADLTYQARDKASNISGATAESARNLPQSGTNAINQTADTVSSNVGGAKDRIHAALYGDSNTTSIGSDNSANSGVVNKASDLSKGATDTAAQYVPESVSNAANASANKASHLASTATETARQYAPGGNDSGSNYTLGQTSDRLANAASSVPRQGGDDQLGSVAAIVDKHANAAEQAATHGVMDRPRGVTQVEQDDRS